MEAIILIGIQGTGKTTFCRERFFSTHMRLNLDMLRSRHRENLFLSTCIAAKQPFVVDNTNATRLDRTRYINPAREAGFRIEGYYFAADVERSLKRNDGRPGKARIPSKGLLGTLSRLERPSPDEGFDRLSYVRISEQGHFVVEEWRSEV